MRVCEIRLVIDKRIRVGIRPSGNDFLLLQLQTKISQVMKRTTSIIYIKPTNSSFIRGDQQILEKEFNVKPFLMKQNINKLIFGFKIIELFIYLLLQAFKKNVIFVAWFADYHSAVMALVAKLTGKKSVVLIGGQEAISYPELNKEIGRAHV